MHCCWWVKHRPFFNLFLRSIMMIFLQSPALGSQSVSLSWDPASDTGVAGYRVYCGTASRDYDTVMDVGNVTSASIPLPLSGVTYYFAVTDYDQSGNQSDFSNEAVYTAPAIGAAFSAVALANGRFSFNISNEGGTPCVIQTSTNLVNWSPVLTNTAPFTFVDSNPAASRQRFYRAVSL